MPCTLWVIAVVVIVVKTIVVVVACRFVEKKNETRKKPKQNSLVSLAMSIGYERKPMTRSSGGPKAKESKSER